MRKCENECGTCDVCEISILADSAAEKAQEAFKDRNVRYVWLNMNTGEFSNSWSQEEHDSCTTPPEELLSDEHDGWKLIKYECVNDPDFQFYNLMRLR